MRTRRYLFFCLAWLLMPAPLWGGVYTWDAITLVKEPVYLKFQTRRGFFSTGGSKVIVQIGDHPEQQVLTGGDGNGYLKTASFEPGLIKVSVRSGDDDTQGRLLVLTKKEKLLLIDAPATLLRTLFKSDELSEAREVLQTLAKTYPLAYLTGFPGTPFARKFLIKKGFPDGVVLRVEGRRSLDRLHEKGIQLYALIGSGEMNALADGLVEKNFSFTAGDEETLIHLENWKDLLEELKQ